MPVLYVPRDANTAQVLPNVPNVTKGSTIIQLIRIAIVVVLWLMDAIFATVLVVQPVTLDTLSLQQGHARLVLITVLYVLVLTYVIHVMTVSS